MVKSLTLVALAIIFLSTLANAGPNALSALEHFKDYQRQVMRGKLAHRQLLAIYGALGISPLFQKTDNYGRPILVLVAYSRSHHRPYEKPFTRVRDEVLRLLPTANFERRLYQLNDLHPGQARQSIWQVRDEDAVMRIEIVPGTSITLAFFSAPDLRTAQHETRRALLPSTLNTSNP